MSPVLRVLMLIDTVADSAMLVEELRHTSFDLDVRCVTTEAAYRAALESPLDLILADTALAAFDALRALQILHASALDIPLIVVAEAASAAAALECVVRGAADFVFKDRPARLRSAVIRALDQRDLRASARAADAVLHESAAINQAVLDSLSAHVALLNADGVIVAVNQAWERFARANGDLDGTHTGVGMNYLNVCRQASGDTSAEAQPVVQGIAAVLARELDQFTLEYPCHAPDEQRWFMMRVTPLAGEHTGAVVAHENITARKRFEEALRESEARFRGAYDDATIGMALVGLDGRCLQANRALCDFTGYTEPELLATTFQAITHPDDLALDLSNLRAVVAGEIRSYQMEKRYFDKQGATIWGLLSVSLVRDAEHQPRYFVAQIQDITARKQADATRALLAAIVDSSDDAIIGVTLDGTVLSWNNGAAQLYGYRAEQMIGQPIAMLWPPELHQEAAQLYERPAHGARTTPVETVRLRSDGQLIDVALTISAIIDASGAVSGFSTIGRDISARKQADRVMHQKTAFIQLLQDVAVAANQSTSFEQALQTAVDTICTQIGWPVGHVYLPDPDRSGALLPSRIWHLDDAQRFATFRTITEAVRLAPGMGLPGQVVTSRKSAWIADMILDDRTPRTRLIQDIGVRAGFALPVLLGDEVAAVLEFFATECIAPDAALLEVLQHVGTQLGRVVERTRAEEQFRVLFEHSPDAIVLIDPHHPTVSWPIVDCNAVACQMNGYTRDQLIGQSVDLLNDVIGSPAERAAYLDRLRRDGTIQIETLHRRNDGSVFPIEIVSSLVVVAGRELVLGIDRDISERNHAQAVRAQLAAIVESSDDAILSSTMEGVITSWNAGAERLYGYTTAEAIGLPAAALIPSDQPLEAAHILEQIERGEPMEHFETVRVRKDGQRIAVSVTISPVKDRAGQIVSISAIARDISVRKQAEEQLLYQANLLHTVSDAIIATDQNFNIIQWNQAAEALYGWRADEVIGTPVHDLLQTVYTYDQPEQVLQHFLEHGSWKGEAIQKRKDGTLCAILAAVSSIKDSTGRQAGTVGVNHDITERKRIEEALRLSAARFRAVWDGAHDAMVLSDPDGMVLEANPAYVQLYRYPSDQIIGHPYSIIFPAEQRAAAMEAYHAFFRDPPSVLNVESQIQRADGITRWVETSASFLVQDGQRTALLSLIRDITERKGLEAALIAERALLARRVEERTADLRAANAELVRAVRLKDEFLASMSHELRTPLNAILGLSEALQEQIYGPLSDQQMKTLGSIEASGRHLLALINDILDLAKLGAGMLELTIEPVTIESLCHASVLLIAQSAHTKQLTVTTTIDPAVVQIPADARRLKQILVNLLANAVKFTPDGGAIGLDVAGDAAGQLVRFTVWDTGIGIAEDQLPKLWQAFVQLDSRLARQYEGTGLGLALVAQMVELHGGTVSVESAVGVGSRFTVALPLGDPPLEPHHGLLTQHGRADQPLVRAELPAVAQSRDFGVQPSPDQLPLGQAAVHPRADAALVIVLAEDNVTNSTFMADYLTMCGYQVVIARNGSEAIDRVHEMHPALVLMDIQMPVMDGLEAIQRIRAEAALPQMPIIALTALAMPGDREQCLAAGANDYLSKPVSLKGLAASIAAYLQPDARVAHPDDRSQ